MVYYIDKIGKLHKFEITKRTKGDPLFYYNFLKSENFRIGKLLQYEMLEKGYEEFALYMVNVIRREFDIEELKLGTKDWEEYKKSLEIDFGKK